MMFTITNRNANKKFQKICHDLGYSVTFSFPGHGTARSEILDYLGIDSTEKVVTISVVTKEMWRKIRRELIVRMHIDVPGTGIAFIIPMSSIGGKKVLRYLIQGNDYEKEEESTLKETKHELLVIIANQGYIDSIMDAARSVKAGGGTVIHAKGAGMDTAEAFLGVSLAAEKEIILIVAKKENKNKIMKAIIEETGLPNKEGSMIFSLPVTSVIGLRLIEDLEFFED